MAGYVLKGDSGARGNVRERLDRREIVSSGSLVGLLHLLLDEATR
ncbi:hypothetical protein GCM10010313_78630 [Streptomyces violarus]|nr:hypothetical protein GCM10010313_78630 [Streptomyces violarus]